MQGHNLAGTKDDKTVKYDIFFLCHVYLTIRIKHEYKQYGKYTCTTVTYQGIHFQKDCLKS